MAKKNIVPAFLPCVATHYRNVALNMTKRITDIKDTVISKHNGHLAPEILEALDVAHAAVTKAVLALDARASKKLFTEEPSEKPVAQDASCDSEPSNVEATDSAAEALFEFISSEDIQDAAAAE